MKRAYSLLEIRAVDDEKRIIEGIATTPEVARDGDVIVTEGIEFKLPLPFLYQHNSRQPIGNVIETKTSKDGIRVRIQVAPTGIAPFIDEAWALIKAKLIRGLSIGWRTLEESFDKTTGGFKILRSEWLELSAVTVPADPNATITAVRSADESVLAALGNRERAFAVRINPPGASGQPEGKAMKTNQERISALEATRAAHMARIEELIAATLDERGETPDQAQSVELDTLQSQVREIDVNLKRLRDHQQMALAAATAVRSDVVTDAATASAARATSSGITVRGNRDLPKATGFTRYAIALYFAEGDRKRAVEIFQSNRVWMDQTPEVLTALRAVVPVGDTVTAGWAAELAPLQNLASEFVELLRPKTLIGRIPGFRNVPFNVLIPRQTAGTEGDWVGEGARKPVGRMTTDSIEFKFTKIAKIVAITEELARFSNPSAEARVRQDLIEGIQVRMDRTLVDPAIAASAGIRPASIFNGADTAGASGTAIANVIADVKAAMATFVALELPVDQIVVLTTPSLAVALSLMRTTLDAPAFPGMTPNGGNLLGFPVFVSSLVPSGHVEFFIPGEVLLADDGQANVSVSNQATLIMDDGGSPSATNAVNLWQENKIGIRAERFVNWMRRRDDSTYYITSANYGG